MEFDLIQLTPEDIQDEWSLWFNSERTQYYSRSGRQIPLDELRETIRIGLEKQTTYTFGIFMLTAQEFIGTVKIGPIDHTHGLADLAILIGNPAYLGKGLGTTIIQKASDLAFRKFPIRKLHSGILEKNIPSIKSYTRAGWVVEGVLYKHFLNRGTPQDWYIISKFNPSNFPDGFPKSHAVEMPL